VRFAWVLLLAVGVDACGGVRFAVVSSDAASLVEQAKNAGGERWAPYDYYYAQAHLEQARVEAEEASYSDAISLAEVARAHALLAIGIAQKAQATAQAR